MDVAGMPIMTAFLFACYTVSVSIEMTGIARLAFSNGCDTSGAGG